MNADDPILEARSLIATGRRNEAIDLLRGAALTMPDRLDIQAALERLRNPDQNSNFPDLSFWRPKSISIGLFVVAYLGTSSMLGLCSAMVFRSAVDSTKSGYVGSAILIVTALVVLASAIALPAHIYFHLWFRYLRSMPDARRRAVEFYAPVMLRNGSREQLYQRLRRRYFGD